MGVNSIKSEILQIEAARDHPIAEAELGAMIANLDHTIAKVIDQLKAEYPV
jgi:hypothetical protein